MRARDTLGYRLTGPRTGPVVVLGGAIATTRAMWAPQLRALEERHRVLAYDHLGHGDSAVPRGPYSVQRAAQALLALLDELGIGSVRYCGVSLGGMVGIWLAAAAPHRVERLALVSTSAHRPPPGRWLDRAALVRAEGMAAVHDAVIGLSFTEGFRQRQPATVERYSTMLLDTPAEGYAGCCEALAIADLRGVLGSVRAPTLVLSGIADPASPPAHGRAIAAGIPDSRFVALPDAAHLSTVEQPRRTTRLLLDHLAEAPDG